MISLVRHLPRFDGRSRFSTWAYRVAVNASLDELRRRKRHPGTLGDPDAVGAPGSGVISSGEGPVDDRLAIEAALAQLPIEFRTPVVLRDLCTLDYAEIAAVLDIPPGTVRSRIARGRAQLADILRIPFEGEREPDLPFRRPTVEP